MEKVSDELSVQIVALLKSAAEPMKVSELRSYLLRHNVRVGYAALEEYVLTESDLFRISSNGRVVLAPRADVSDVKPVALYPRGQNDLSNVNQDDKVHRLIKYYEECLREEGKLIEPYREYQDKTFQLLDEEIITGRKSRFTLVLTEHNRALTQLAVNKQCAFYYGYPFLLRWVESADGEFADYKIIPVFLWRLDMVSNPPRFVFDVRQKEARLNPAVWRWAGRKEKPYIKQMLDPADGSEISLAERLKLLPAVMQDEPLVEILDPSSLKRSPSLASLPDDSGGIYNRAGLFAGTPNPYIQGLSRELQSLASRPVQDFEGTALGELVGLHSGDQEEAEAEKTSRRVVQSLSSLNFYQERAVRIGMDAPLSVVTGPPGTGKSQVVTNLIVNSIANGQTVLFASRNRKAVDVVSERLHKDFPGSQILTRVGGEHDSELVNNVNRFLQLPSDGSSENLRASEDKLQGFAKGLERAWEAMGDYGARLVAVNSAESTYEAEQQDIFHGRASAYAECVQVDAASILSYVRVLNRVYSAAKRWRVFSSVFLRIFSIGKKKLVNRVGDALESLSLQNDIQCWPSTLDDANKQIAYLVRVMKVINAAKDMSAKAALLGAASDLGVVKSDIVTLKGSISEWLSEHISTLLKNKISESSRDSESSKSIHAYMHALGRKSIAGMTNNQQNIANVEQCKFFKVALNALPAWAVTNLSISSRIPLGPAMFDLCIIDEASQCDIPSCLPLLFRAKRAVIIGDPLQLSKITQLSDPIEQKLLATYGLGSGYDASFIYSKNSMFDVARYAALGVNSTFLAGHYRCHPDIIKFSNSSHWYDERLEVLTDTSAFPRPTFWKQGISWVDVESSYSAANDGDYWLPDEVEATVAQIKALLEAKQFEGTLGVVTPFRKMADRISDQVEKNVNSALLQAVRFEANTAHKFQGDERDVMICCMAVHPEMPRGSKWFLGEQRNVFNVALSRARAAFIVIGDQEAIRNCEVGYLQDFIEYYESLENSKQKINVAAEPVFADDQLWEKCLYEAMCAAGMEAICQHPVGPYRLDLALLQDGRKLDIEVDGERWHKDSAGQRLQKDIDRDIYTKAQDWDVMRFWVYEIREDVDKCVERIKKWMN